MNYYAVFSSVCTTEETWQSILAKLGYQTAMTNDVKSDAPGYEILNKETGTTLNAVVLSSDDYIEYLTTDAPMNVIEAISLAMGIWMPVVDFQTQKLKRIS